MPRRTNRRAEVAEGARVAEALEEQERSRDRHQLSTYEGREWAYAFVHEQFKDPGRVSDGELREWLGRWRVARDIWRRLWAHPELARQAILEAAQRDKQRRDRDELEERAREEQDKRRREADPSPSLDSDYSP